MEIPGYYTIQQRVELSMTVLKVFDDFIHRTVCRSDYNRTVDLLGWLSNAVFEPHCGSKDIPVFVTEHGIIMEQFVDCLGKFMNVVDMGQDDFDTFTPDPDTHIVVIREDYIDQHIMQRIHDTFTGTTYVMVITRQTHDQPMVFQLDDDLISHNEEYFYVGLNTLDYKVLETYLYSRGFDDYLATGQLIKDIEDPSMDIIDVDPDFELTGIMCP